MKVFGLVFCLTLSVNGFFQDQTTMERIQVVLRDVRVHVADKQGNPVEGLKPSDFILKESGEDQQVDFFEEVDQRYPRQEYMDDPSWDQDETHAEEPARSFRDESNIVVVLDSSNMRAEAFPEFKAVVRDFIDENLGKGELVKIVQIEDRLIHLSPFLKGKGSLLNALEKSRYQGTQITRLRRQERKVSEAYSDYLEPSADAEDYQFFRQDRIMELREAVRAKEQIKRNHFVTFAASMEHIAKAFNQMSGSKTVYLFTGGGYVDRGRLAKGTRIMSNRLGRVLNSANVTLYTFIHVPRKSVFDDFASTDHINLALDNGPVLARAANVDPNTLRNPIRELGNANLPVIGTIFEDVADLVTAPADATENTGGIIKPVHRLTDFKRAFEEFNESIKHYYRLGYTLANPADRTKIKITLKNKRKGWKLFYGKQFDPIKTYLEMEEDEKIIAFESSLVYSKSLRNDMDCDFGFTGFKGRKKGEVVPVYLELEAPVPAAKGYDVGFAALNDQGDLIDYCHATIKRGSQSKKLLFYDVLLPRAKPTLIRFQIINLDNGDKSNFEMAYQRREVEENGFQFSGLSLAQSRDVTVVPINHLRSDPHSDKQGYSQAAMRKLLDPFGVGKEFYVPNLGQEFPASKDFQLFFQLRNTQWPVAEYAIFYTLSREGKTVPATIQMTELNKVEAGVFNCRGNMSTEELEPGEYLFSLGVRHDDHDAQIVTAQKFVILARDEGNAFR